MEPPGCQEKGVSIKMQFFASSNIPVGTGSNVSQINIWYSFYCAIGLNTI
jgi:hypothetical protein